MSIYGHKLFYKLHVFCCIFAGKYLIRNDCIMVSDYVESYKYLSRYSITKEAENGNSQ